MKAANLALALSVLFLSPTGYISAQQDVVILAKIDESDDYKKRKVENAELYAGLQVPNYAQVFEPTSNQVGFESGMIVQAEKSSHEWLNLNLSDDGSVLIALPFEFVFYGETHTEIWVNANGNISFNQSVGSFKSENFPIMVPMIAPFWADLTTADDDRSGVFVSRKDDSMRFLWQNMRIVDGYMFELVSFELVIYATENSTTENGNIHAEISDYRRPQPIVRQGKGNKHILINYLELPIDITHHSDDETPAKYVAGVNSGNGTCGHHAFDVQVNSAFAYLKE